MPLQVSEKHQPPWQHVTQFRSLARDRWHNCNGLKLPPLDSEIV